MKVKVRVPATSANIGPGFDSLGIAFNLYNIFEFTEKENGISFSGCAKKYQNEHNICYEAYKRVADAAGKNVGGLHISFSCNVPVARGLGSSAALIAAGAVAANEILDCHFSKLQLLNICAPMEGHADNLAPALLGGFTASMLHEGKVYTVKYRISERLHFCALIPDFEVKTATARSVLPQTYSRADAVYNLSHSAILIKALETGNIPLLIPALTDRLHQPYRESLIQDYDKAKEAAKLSGAPVFFISGSGSTCMCISDKDVSKLLRENLKELPNNWQVYPLSVDFRGASIIKHRKKFIK